MGFGAIPVHGADKHVNVSREKFFPVTFDMHPSATLENIGNFPVIQLADGVIVDTLVSFKVPDDFVSFQSLKLRWESPAASGDLYWYMGAHYGAPGETYQYHSETGSYGTTATGGQWVRNEQEPATPLALPGLVKGDDVGICIFRDGSSASDTLNDVVNIIGLVLTYIAEQ